jgi:hypothetical protein
MKRPLIYLVINLLTILDVSSQSTFNGLEMNMGNLYRLSNAKTRSISPENFTGEKGKGAMTRLENKDITNVVNVTMENIDDKEPMTIYYQIDYIFTQVSDNDAYFHAKYKHQNPNEISIYIISDNIKGKGQFVGAILPGESTIRIGGEKAKT